MYTRPQALRCLRDAGVRRITLTGDSMARDTFAWLSSFLRDDDGHDAAKAQVFRDEQKQKTNVQRVKVGLIYT